MSDIMTFIRDREAFEKDPDGHLIDLDEWNREIAQSLAEEERIILEDKHWEVLFFLREWYRQNGEAESATELMKHVEGKFANHGGRRYLYSLFPGGPIRQACKIAGLPIPPHSANSSFGSVL